MATLTIEVAFFIPTADGFAFVVFALTPGQGQGGFGLSVLEVDPERDQSQPFFVHFAVQSFDLVFMKKQFAGTQGLVVAVIGKGVLADMHLVKKDLAVFDSGIRIF